MIVPLIDFQLGHPVPLDCPRRTPQVWYHQRLRYDTFRLTCCRGRTISSNGRRQPMAISRDFSLEDKYRREEGMIILSGIQALVRLPLDQHRADRRRGVNTATLISGYRGSPPGGGGRPPPARPATRPPR